MKTRMNFLLLGSALFVMFFSCTSAYSFEVKAIAEQYVNAGGNYVQAKLEVLNDSSSVITPKSATYSLYQAQGQQYSMELTPVWVPLGQGSLVIAPIVKSAGQYTVLSVPANSIAVVGEGLIFNYSTGTNALLAPGTYLLVVNFTGTAARGAKVTGTGATTFKVGSTYQW
ncbi:MAG: hypothetical protein HQL12_06420 [Candidatus Omnitrophica bacterium]|nr:hypothetical protein [Candidatus Omnitrophota bacterium]